MFYRPSFFRPRLETLRFQDSREKTRLRVFVLYLRSTLLSYYTTVAHFRRRNRVCNDVNSFTLE